MVGRHIARGGGLRRVGDVVVGHPFRAGAVVTGALVAALVVTPLVTADLVPAPARSQSSAPGATAVVALSVPNVIGLSEPRATDTLRARGFSTQSRTEPGASATGGTDYVVTRQSPGAGSHVAKGTTIALTVAPAGTIVSTPPQNASAPTGPGTVSAPAASGITPATGGAGGTGGAGNAGGAGGTGGAGSGGAAPASPAPAPATQPPAVPQPAPPVTPPPVVHAPTPPLPSLPLPKLPVLPLGVVTGFLRGIV
ncbi:PASTA domain-containing protein [Leifsonia sp. NPDC056665]|uniref:PASTA domain-containing protein n=1 Tax=Leifsonia sp. NPDC056665 TaxID=3345901 RepID=UPI0036B7A5CF